VTARARSAAAARPRAATAPAPRRAPRPAPARPAPTRRRSATGAARLRRPRLRLGLGLIPLGALLLGGIVWVNVAKLQLTTQTSAVVERAQRAEAESIRLEAQLGQRNGVVVSRAQDRLGMILPGDEVTFLDPPVRRQVR
jgi:hypothetical protein